MTHTLSTIPETISGWAERSPDRIALFAPDRDPLSYAGLVQQATLIHGVLDALKIAGSARVAVSFQDRPAMAVGFIGALFHGSTAVPVDPNLTSAEIESYLTEARATALLTDAGPGSAVRRAGETLGLTTIGLAPQRPGMTLSASVAPAAPAGKPAPLSWPDPSDAAYLVSTSGTTGRKIVPRTHQEVLLNLQKKNTTAIKTVEQDICLNPPSLYFNQGLHGGLLTSLLTGGGVILCSGTDVAQFFDCLGRFSPTWILTGYAFMEECLARADGYREVIRSADLSFITTAGTACPADRVAEIERVFGTRLFQCYAMTEVSTIACPPTPPTTMKPGTVGVPVVAEIAIFGDDGAAVPPGETGEIAVRDPGVIKGYLDNPQANAETFIDGWFRTGDLGFLDTDGFLTLQGRKKDIINRGGEKISPAEVEKAIAGSPEVREVCVFGIPHPTLSEIVAAAVVPAPGSDLDETHLTAVLRERLSTAKMPLVWLFLDALPTTPTGKMRRDRLVEMYRQSRNGGSAG